MDNQNTPREKKRATSIFVLILVLMDNQNTPEGIHQPQQHGVLILVLMDNQNTVITGIFSINANAS